MSHGTRLLILLIPTGLLLTLLFPEPVLVAPRPAATIAKASPMTGPVGSASCSAQACHGRVEPRPGEQEILRNEYTTWVREDRHARAYEVLLREDSREMARRLGGEPAHQSKRCLACHSSPALPGERPPRRHEGVGCEACHGSAEKWLVEHTSPQWANRRPEDKYNCYKMTPLTDVSVVASACVGCHVGSPPEEGVALRDVTHDLLAVGHPRLNFEFAGYLDAMPPHWNAARRAVVRGSGFEARAWAVGQMISARAALALLGHRVRHAGDKGAARTPWPEFAEYDCFACHHDLREPSWRRSRGYGSGNPGSLPWGTWYFTMPRLLAEERDGKARPADDALARLEQMMAEPYADAKLLSPLIVEADRLLDDWQKKVKGESFDRLSVRRWLRVLAGDDRKLSEREWDGAAQLYLALRAIDRARADMPAGAGVNAGGRPAPPALEKLAERLAFPSGHQSPKTFREDRGFDVELRRLLEQLRPE